MRHFREFLVVSAIFASSLPAVAASQRLKGMGVGAGLSYAAPNHATFVNPASLLDATDGVSVEGLYHFDPESPQASVAAAFDRIGLGATYRQYGSADVLEGGFGASLGDVVALGASVRSVDGGGLDGDLGMNVDVGNMRFALVAKGLSGGLDGAGGGVGFRFANAVLAFDVRKPWPADSDAWLFDATFAASASRVSVAVGYDFSRVGGSFENGGIHAGISLAALDKLFVEGHYRLLVQDLGVGDWTAGVRYVF
jgi:hypothetical protein